MYIFPRNCFVVGAFALALLLLSTGAGSPKGGSTDVAALMSQVTALEKEGKLKPAVAILNRVMFAHPTYKKAAGKLSKIQRKQIAALLVKAKASYEKNPAAGLKWLRQAASIQPLSKKVKSQFKKWGYRPYQTEWLTKAQISERISKNPEVEIARRKELKLGDDFKILYEGPFRFFTNVNVRQAKPIIQQMINSNASHLREYQRVMRPFGLQQPRQLDLVLFDTKEQYTRYVRRDGTAGVYIPMLGAGFFFRDGGIAFGTMLHEMTHQLNDKLLRNYGVHAWYEEGISEYFGAAFLTQAGKRMAVGRVETSRLMAFKQLLQDSPSSLALSRFTVMQQAELTSQFYSEAWALVYFLLEIHPKGRWIFYDYVHGLLRERSIQDFEGALVKNGLTLAGFEREFFTYFKTGSLGGA